MAIKRGMAYKRMIERQSLRSLLDSTSKGSPLASRAQAAKDANTLIESDAVTISGKTYQKLRSLGRGDYFQAFETNVPGVVLKHIHEDGLLRLRGRVKEHFSGIKENAEKAKKNGIPCSPILNLETIETDLVVLEPKFACFLHELPPPLHNEQIFSQVRKIFQQCWKEKTLLEVKPQNLAIDSTGNVLVADLDGQTAHHGLEINLDVCLKQCATIFGEKIATSLDPRPQTPQ